MSLNNLINPRTCKKSTVAFAASAMIACRIGTGPVLIFCHLRDNVANRISKLTTASSCCRWPPRLLTIKPSVQYCVGETGILHSLSVLGLVWTVLVLSKQLTSYSHPTSISSPNISSVRSPLAFRQPLLERKAFKAFKALMAEDKRHVTLNNVSAFRGITTL